MSIRKLIVLLLSMGACISSSYAGDNLGSLDQLEVHTSLSNIIQPTLERFYNHSKYKQYPTPNFFLLIDFDKSKFTTAQKEYDQKISKAKADHIELQKNRFKEMYKEVTGRGKSAQAENNVKRNNAKKKSDIPRFGRLNIDLDPVLADDIIDSGLSSVDGDSGPAISIQMPSIETALGFDPFTYDPIVYVKSLKVQLSLPDNTSDGELEILKTSISQSIAFTGIKLDVASDFEITKLQPFEGAGAIENMSLAEWFMSPSNATIGILMASFVLGLFGVICIFLLSKVFSRIAGSIAELKPEPVADSIGENNAVDTSVGGSQDEIIVNADVEEVDTARGGSGHDAAAALSAMTSEMRTIRDQLAEIIADSAQVCSELLRDLCYEKHGMEDFRDLLSFAGYTALKDAMEMLPESVILQLQAYIEDNRDSQVDLLRGCEVAQRIYRDTVSKISVKSDANDQVDALKDVLIKVDDAPLDVVTADASAEEIAMLLRILSVERGNRMMKSLDGVKLKSACDLLDTKFENESDLCNGLVQKLEEAQGSVEHTSQLQTRFILRLAKSATIDEEESLLEIIPKDDWTLKFTILKNRFLFGFTKFIPAADLRKIFDSYDLSKRAEMLFVVEDEIKQSVISEYPEGSKMLDMINDELQNVENNKKRNESVRKNKPKLVLELLEKIRAKMSSDDEILEKTLIAEFEANGSTVPTEITAKYAQTPEQDAA